MVIDGMGSTLTIFSDTHTAAGVTETLGIEPSKAHETEWSTPRGPVRHYSLWQLHVDEAAGEGEHTMTSLSGLAELLDGKADALASLADRYDMRLSWGGSSDNWQGGFVMPAELLAKLGPLGSAGVYMHPTVYLRTPRRLWSRLRWAFQDH